MNERIRLLAKNYLMYERFSRYGESTEEEYYDFLPDELEEFVQLIVREYAQEYQKLVDGHGVVLPKNREHAENMVRVGMFYLENNR